MRVGVDVGGTFTDFVAWDGRALLARKVRSSPSPGRVVRDGVQALGGATVAHGTTVATNAVLEGRGARVAFVTTEGFEDLLAIGRQDRPSLYDLRVARPEAIVPDGRRFGLRERVSADGAALREPGPGDLEAVAAAVRASGAESVAVCLLFSFLRPEHERRVRAALRDVPVSLSSDVLPEFREYERASTTALDAYVKPLAARYLEDLEASLGPLLVLRSSGGVLASPAVRERPIEMLLSGPTGGVAAARVLAAALGEPELVTFDMGGTSADVSLLSGGEIAWTTEASLGGHPIGIPVVDVASVGAGGGSVAWFDAGGALRVGPRSAGSDPGPMCYGLGGAEFTVADADLLAGMLPGALLGRSMPLDVRAAERGLARLLPSFRSRDEAVLAVQGVVRATMASAVRLALSRRGTDPRRFALLSFGGAGAIHAALLARDLGIRRVLVPFLAGAFSAYGALVSDARLDFGRTRVLPLEGAGEAIRATLEAFSERARGSFLAQGFPEAPVLAPSVDLRYVGQSYEVNVPLGPDLASSFHRRHEALYGHAAPGEPVELVTVRLAATIPRPRPLPDPVPAGRPEATARSVAFPEGRETAAVLRREALPVGFEADGPLVVEEDHATTVVPPGASLLVRRHGVLSVEVGA